MSRRSETWNAYESKLAGPLPALSTSVTVESTAGLDDPAYLVIDPDKPTLREWIRVGTISPGLFENIARNQEGSVGNIDHDTGAIVRAVFTKQLQDDIFDDVDDIEGAITGHVNVGQQPDPHSQYLLESTAEVTYVPLAGTQAHLPMTGALQLYGPPTASDIAATKQYVDDAGALYLPLLGGTMLGALDMGGFKVVGLADGVDPADAATFGQLTAHEEDTDAHPGLFLSLVDGGNVLAPTVFEQGLRVEEGLAAAGVILWQESFNTAKIAHGVLMATMVIDNPGMEGGSIVDIECTGVAGFHVSGVDVTANFVGVDTDIHQYVWAEAAKWATFFAYGTVIFASATEPSRTVTILSSILDGDAAYWRGEAKAWVRGYFGN